MFHSLKQEQIRAIAELQVEFLRQRLAEQDLELSLSVTALDRLGNAGFDPVYGARPLKRAVQTLIETPLAQALLEGRFGPGDEIRIDVADDEFVFTSPRANAA